MPRLWRNYERSFAFDAITSRLAYLVLTHHWIYSLCIWSWLSIQFSLSCHIQEHMRHWLLSSSLLLFVQCVLFPTLPCQLYVNSLASLSLSDSVSGPLPGNLIFYHEMMSWLSWLLSLLTSLIIISSTKEQRSILNNDRLYRDGQPAVLQQTAASSCHFLSEISDETVARCWSVTGNRSHVAAQSFHCLGKKTDDSARWCF